MDRTSPLLDISIELKTVPEKIGYAVEPTVSHQEYNNIDHTTMVSKDRSSVGLLSFGGVPNSVKRNASLAVTNIE